MNGGNTPVLCAIYNEKGGQRSRPVLGWDDEGYALTVDWAEGRLRRAVDLDGFVCLDEDEVKHTQIRGVLPAPEGWHLVTREKGLRGIQPIVGWTVNGFGCGDPLVVDARGDLIVANTQGSVACAPGEDPEAVKR